MPRRKLKRASPSNLIEQAKPTHVENQELTEIEPSPQRVQQQLLDDETRILQVWIFFLHVLCLKLAHKLCIKCLFPHFKFNEN